MSFFTQKLIDYFSRAGISTGSMTAFFRLLSPLGWSNRCKKYEFFNEPLYIKNFGYKVQCMLLDLLAKITGSMKITQRRKLAALLTWLAFDILQLRRKYVISAISLHLELSPDEAVKMARQVYFNFLLNAFEMSGLKFMSNEDLNTRLYCADMAILKQALSRKKGAIIISGHFGLWELVPPWLSLNGLPVTVVVRRQNNPEVDRWMEEMRQKHGARTTDSGFGIREILKSLRKGHILALMVDQDNGKQGIFVPFFKAWASAPTGPAAISIKTGAPIVPLALFPDFNGRHRLKIWPAIFPENYSDDVEGHQKMTRDYTQIVEQMVRQQPKQWFWLHRRWKTRPEDAPENDSVKILNLL